MTIHPNSTPDPTTIPPAIYVEKLSFRYRSLDDDPQPKRKAGTPATEPLEQPQAIENISSGKENLTALASEIHQHI